MMTYIQLSLLGVGARVTHGDSLAWKFQQVLYTPFYFLNNFEYKLKKQNRQDNTQFKEQIINKQLTLFNF